MQRLRDRREHGTIEELCAGSVCVCVWPKMRGALYIGLEVLSIIMKQWLLDSF